jgi:integrase
MEAYLDDMDRQGKKSADDARKRVALHITPMLGAVLVEKLTRIRLEKWRDGLANAPKSRKVSKKPVPKNPRKPEKYLKPKVAPPSTPEEKRARKASANRVLSILKAGLTYALDRGLVRCPDDAWTRVKPFKGTDEPREAYLTDEEQQRLLNAIKDTAFKRLVSGALATGCRYSELCRMTVSDFEPVSNTVRVKESKAGKYRFIPLTPTGREFFESLTAGRGKKETMFRRSSVERRTLKDGDHLAWRPSEQKRLMSEACDAAKLPRMGFHQLRHSYASSLVAAGMPLALVAELTGHADIRMLEKNYSHIAPSVLKKALDLFAPSLNFGNSKVENLKIKTSS